MAGYNGYSMSNNAVSAYDNGEKPLSKWRKSDILEEIEIEINAGRLELLCDYKKLKKLSATALKEVCLYRSSWHHTSNYYNRTDFYSIDFSRVCNLTNEDIDRINDSFEPVSKKENPVEKWECAFLEWSGTRRHPKAVRIVEIGEIKGDWFYRQDGSKKKITANGFEFLRKI